ncbi:MAG: hypothetical protein E7606_02085 [Ruminococcaceae bacterium]|nr:hypothetical protein [Oscillospiraceae bacterium]
MAIVKYRGKDGKVRPIRAIQGNDGNQMYVRFSAYADGTDMSEKWDAERNFMGIAFAYETPTEKEQYQWISLADISLGHYAEEGSEDKYLFFVGNGTNEDNRSNALTLDAEGVLWLLGDLLIGEERTSVLEEFEAVKERASNLESRADALESCVPEWNVEGNVGAISPATNLETSIVIENYTTSEVTPLESEEKSFSFPIINTGKIYLDFNDVLSVAIPTNTNGIVWETTAKIYVNGNLITEYSRTYKTNIGGYSNKVQDIVADHVFTTSNTTYKDTVLYGASWHGAYVGSCEETCRTPLEVAIGDVVTVTLKVTTTHHYGSLYAHEYATHSLKNLQLKANIVSAHTYCEFGEKIEGLTAEEILNTIFGEE